MYDKQLEEALARAFPVAHDVTDDDVSGAFVVQYVPELGTGGSAATAAFDGSDMSFEVDAAAPAGNDAIGTAGVLSLATYTTLGALQDIVNASRCFRMYLGTGKRADLTATAIVAKTATSCIGANGLTFYHDTSAHSTGSIHSWGFVISGEKFINNKASGWRKDWGGQCINVLTYLAFQQSAATGGNLEIHMGKQGSTEELVWKHGTTDATLKEINASLSRELALHSSPGKRLIVRYEGDIATSVTCMNGTGKTAVMDGSFAVTEKNY